MLLNKTIYLHYDYKLLIRFWLVVCKRLLKFQKFKRSLNTNYVINYLLILFVIRAFVTLHITSLEASKRKFNTHVVFKFSLYGWLEFVFIIAQLFIVV